MEDAHRAAEVICRALNPAEVMVFGSVARGLQHPLSDIDLVVLFDDLGDYKRRGELARRAEAAVTEATGFPANVKVTDRPEWKVRTELVKSSFEAHIASHAVRLVTRPSNAQIDWNKEIGLAPSDAQQAENSLGNTLNSLDNLRGILSPYEHEVGALEAGDAVTAREVLQNRMLRVCSLSQEVMENALKSLIHALRGEHPRRVHSIEGLMDFAQAQLDASTGALLLSALDGLQEGKISGWRQGASYPDDMDMAVSREDATPEYAWAMATAAARVAQRCAETIEAQFGHPTTRTAEVITRCNDLTKWMATRATPGQDPDHHPTP